MHGGTNPGAPPGNKNRLVHGIYSAGLLPEESDLWGEIAVGSIDDDIRIAKLQLRRALIAQNKVAKDGLEAYEETVDGGGGEGSEAKPAATFKRRRNGYDEVISRLLGRIGDLEQKRAEMMERSGGNKANADETARKVRELLAAMRSATSA